MDIQRNNIALYAAIKTFHSSGHDVWSAVSALTLLVMPDKGTEEDVKRNFTQQYQLDVPTEALKTILSRLKKDGFIDYANKYADLTKEGVDYRGTLEKSVSSLRREYRSLTQDFEQYLIDKDITPPTQLDNALLDFIDDNIGFASEIVSTKAKQKSWQIPGSAIADYIIHIEKDSPVLFEILQNVFFGRLYLTLIKTRTDLDKNAKFDKLTVYLDTNILLSLLNFHDPVSVKSAQELLAVLKEFSKNITIAALDVTVNEALSLLDACANDKTPYLQGLSVDSTQYRLKAQYLDRYDLSLLMENLEENVQNLGIEIEATPALDENKYLDTRSEINKIVTLLDATKSPNALDHDATLIETVKLKRGSNRSKLLEKSKALFITPDLSVVKYARERAEANKTFPLVIRPIEIISLLWVKAIGRDQSNFSSGLLKHAVMGYARERLINHNLWKAFIAKLEEAQSKGQISRDDVGIILAADETEKLLRSNNAEVVKAIVSPDYVQKIRDEHEALKLENQASQDHIQKLSQNLTDVSALTSEVKSEKATLEKEHLSIKASLTAYDKGLRNFAKTTSTLVINAISVVIVIVFLILAFVLLSRTGLDTIASIFGTAPFIVLTIWATLFGQELKPIKVIIKLRQKGVIYFENIIYKLANKVLLTQKSATIEEE